MQDANILFRGGEGLMVLKKCEDFFVVVRAKPLLFDMVRAC